MTDAPWVAQRYGIRQKQNSSQWSQRRKKALASKTSLATKFSEMLKECEIFFSFHF